MCGHFEILLYMTCTMFSEGCIRYTFCFVNACCVFGNVFGGLFGLVFGWYALGMITFLKGLVVTTTADALVLDVHGVGYEVMCSSKTLARCVVGQELQVLTHHHMTETGQALYGFLEDAERQVFRRVIQISGVGPKAGLSILSTLTPSELADAVATQSGKTLARANGIGPKLGERIVRELKDKLGALPVAVDGGAVSKMALSGGAADVLSALVNMGFREMDVQPVVTKIFEDNAGLAFDVALKQTLQHLKQ